ncbi:carbohydrate kinase family protein [Natronolimnohabitans innermongolicus]|uniref:PfkB domain-containing protein n=1 Tax=Natronolimnohabitans innermongolicus JCM 12255 TaxID=1227499 RepID=L9WGG8_9EURY|nr:carbohydrate kinase family protein [Natronolimnohabitans innermongolicus]ELY48529.1 PfkB domain-containing protein [Natronolimnohabitans innermongolicus JCM 12255]
MTETLDVVAVGSALLDEQYAVSNLPEPDGGAFAYDESVAFGGVAANVAVALSRLDRSTGVVARLGDDDIADAVTADLRTEGVALDRVRRGDERSTYCMVFRDADGERTIVTRGGAAKNLRLTERDEATLRSADIVFANGFCPDRVTSRLCSLAANGAIELAFDLASPLDGLTDRGTERETIDDLLPYLDLFVANEASIRSYLGDDGRDAVEVLRTSGVSRGALTRGERGALLWTDDSVVELSAMDVPVVDTTGAGDAFVSGLLHRWVLENEPMRSAGRFATAAAGYNCTEQGARGGMVGEGQLEDVLRNQLV